MENVFPSEIIEVSAENHFSEFNKRSHNIYLALIVLLVVAGISTCLFKVDITILGKGIIRSGSEPICITSPVISKVTKVAIKNNQFVKKGDTLIWLDTDKFESKLVYLQNLINSNTACLQDINLMFESRFSDVKTSLYLSVCNEFTQKLSDYNLNIEELQTVHNRSVTLLKKGVIPQAEKEKSEYRLKNMIEKKNVYIRLSMNEWEQSAKHLREENYNYLNEIKLLRKDIENHFILAPGNGYIVNFNGISAGSYANIGQVIASISPSDKLVAEHLIPPEDIGFLHKGMEVNFQIDAYNFNEWGLASGTITDISNEIYLVNNNPVFKVRCDITESYLTLKNGYKGYIKKGLTTTTRFRITQRTIFQLIFDKTDNWLNPAKTEQ